MCVYNMMKTVRNIACAIVMLFAVLAAYGQERKEQNKPYIDLRPLHFGILVGLHLQDVEFETANNSGGRWYPIGTNDTVRR